MKFLIFEADGKFGIDINCVEKVFRASSVMPLKTLKPPFFGIIIHGETIIPCIDMLSLDSEKKNADAKDKLIILKTEKEMAMGLRVRSVYGIEEITEQEIIRRNGETLEIAGKNVVLLNVEKILSQYMIP